MKEKVSLLMIYLLVIPSTVFKTNSCDTKEVTLTTNPLIALVFWLNIYPLLFHLTGCV